MKQIMDGCTAATHVAFAMSDVATIYPITPVASMGETAQKWGLEGRRNYAGMPLAVKEMESELGAAGATHGAAAAGALATTFTNSQGLMLMIPNMYKIAGNRLPVVFHVGTRSLATHALSIFGDHQDVMATRATGFSFLCSEDVQEVMDLAIVAHLAAVEGSMPVCHFFDGWRTSNEMESIEVVDYQHIFPLINRDAVARFRSSALNPEHPQVRGSAQNPDVYFQNAEAANPFYSAFPQIVQEKMDALARVTSRQYHLFDYYGAGDAEVVTVALGSANKVIRQTVDALNEAGYRVGCVSVRLFRPFSAQAMVNALPGSVKTVVVLDRTKEPGADGEPLYKDVCAALMQQGQERFAGALPRVIGGRYGLASKDFTPAMAKAVFDNALSAKPLRNFTVGIIDDVTHLSLNVDTTFRPREDGVTSAIFYGFGSDGTVGATKQAANIIGNTEGLWCQAYFSYSAKKSGGYTVSELRIGPSPIRQEYEIDRADYVACHKPEYVDRFHMARRLKEGGTFVINCPWTPTELPQKLPLQLRRELAAQRARLYIIDAQRIATANGLGPRINMIMETVYLHLHPVIPFDTAYAALQQQIRTTYLHEGEKEVQANLAAISQAVAALQEVPLPNNVGTHPGASAHQPSPDTPSLSQRLLDGQVRTTSFLNPLPQGDTPTERFVREIAAKSLQLEGDSLPVSLFPADGAMPMGTTAYERRRIAVDVPQWDPDKCVECTECSLVCAHAAIRPYLLDSAEAASAPVGMPLKPGWGDALKEMKYRIQVYPQDCTGCQSCVNICPGHALSMTPMMPQVDEQAPLLDYCRSHVTSKEGIVDRFSINGSQFCQPLLEFSGACAGCGETPYIKLLTQLFGERMIIANATGCSSIWGANYPSNAYTTRPDGRGAAWGNSLFEDNAEYGYGMAVSVRQRREGLRQAVQTLTKSPDTSLAAAAAEWVGSYSIPGTSRDKGLALMAAIDTAVKGGADPTQFAEIKANADLLGLPSVWSIGGDGWAYDIGFAGLDHVLATGENINLLVMDTECYSNTGGQTSKATPLSAVTKYSPDGKRVFKKDLGRMMMQYGTIYVASIALGADYQQAIDALREAEAFPGPSIVICYCPCINHGIRAGMGDSIIEEKRAVTAGYWPLYRFNPAATPKLSVDYKAPDGTLAAFLAGEDRYADLSLVAPGLVAPLHTRLATRQSAIFKWLTRNE